MTQDRAELVEQDHMTGQKVDTRQKNIDIEKICRTGPGKVITGQGGIQ